MHPGSSTPTNKVERHSMTDGGLEGIYKSSQQLAVARGDGGRNFNAKNVGTEPAGAVNTIAGNVDGGRGDIIQKNFKIKQPLKVTQFTETGLNYSTNILKVDTKKYAAGGRL